ncbi:MAG: hypothetical protein WCT77_08690, partial [Bacteroidota bacterium]
MKQNNISFLFGSGASLAAGLPSTSDITNEIMENYNNRFKDNEGYSQKSSSNQGNPNADYPIKIHDILKIINDDLNNYYKKVANTDYTVNYEEVFDILQTLNNALSRDVDYPVSNKLIEHLLLKINPLSAYEAIADLKTKIMESMNFIKSIIHVKLIKKEGCIDYFSVLADITNHYQLKDINIFTLNHDFLVEKYLSKKLIYFYDGFGEKDKYG